MLRSGYFDITLFVKWERFPGKNDVYNSAQMPAHHVKEICQISDAGTQWLKTAIQKLNLSARAQDCILKVSRTIADLSESPEIKIEHLAEAIQYRSLDRENWAG